MGGLSIQLLLLVAAALMKALISSPAPAATSWSLFSIASKFGDDTSGAGAGASIKKMHSSHQTPPNASDSSPFTP